MENSLFFHLFSFDFQQSLHENMILEKGWREEKLWSGYNVWKKNKFLKRGKKKMKIRKKEERH